MIPEKPYKTDGLHEEPTTPKPNIKIVAQNAIPQSDDSCYKKETIEDVTKRIHELKERTRERVIEFRDILKSIEKDFYPGETMKKFDDLVLAFYEIYEEQDSLIEDLSKFFIV